MGPPVAGPVSPSEFGQRVRRTRKAGRRRTRFPEELGVSLGAVHRRETGEAKQPSRCRLRKPEGRRGIPSNSRSFSGTPSHRRIRKPEGRVAEPEPSWPVADPPVLDFGGDPAGVSALVEALCLEHGHEFNPAFGIETSRIDPLPHQRIAVYEHLLQQDPLRFLLADDAGAGKTIMTGLLVRELLTPAGSSGS